MVGIAVDLTKLLIGVDLHNICRMHNSSCDDHAILLIECFFPKRTIILRLLAKFLYTIGNCISVLFYKVADSDHRIAASVFWYSYQFHLAVYTNIAFILHKIADHIPRVQFMAVERIAVTPDVARNNVCILQMLFYQF